jgi:hypothetical protein
LRLIAIAAAIAATNAHAQVAKVTTRATNSSFTVNEGAVVTAVFVLRNTTAANVSLESSLVLPKGWSNVTGLAPRALAANATDTWIAGVSVPANAPAGRYVIRGSVRDGTGTSTDSIVVVVEENRALEVIPIAVPSWTPARGAYEATFLVRNRGNVTSTVDLTGRTSRGEGATASPAFVILAPGATARVSVRVAMAMQIRTTADDVIELAARIRGTTDSAAVASSRTTVVPDGQGNRAFESIPASIAIRSSNGAAGVAPVTFRGMGRIDGTHTDVDFLFQAPTNQNGPVNFGEREEYRLAVKSDHLGARIGDHVFGWSTLSSSGLAGTGGELRASQGSFETGAYAQRPRWSQGTTGEQGAFLGINVDSSFRVSGVGLMRQNEAGIPVRVAALNSTARIFGNNVQLEAAASDSAGRGYAYRARVSRSTRRLSYEAGYTKGGANFAGPFGGWMSTGASASVQLPAGFSLVASANMNEWGGRDSSTIAAGERHTTATASLSWRGATTLEYGRLVRRSLNDPSDRGANQQGVRITSARTFGILAVTLGAERGNVRDNSTLDGHHYTQGSISLSTSAGRFGSLGVNAVYNHGNTLTGLTNGIADLGVNTTIRLPFGFEVGLAGTARRASLGVLDSSGAWFSVMDARLDKRIASGSVIGVHARSMESPYTARGVNGSSNAVYLEYRRDLRVPLKPVHETGRATGRVTNEAGAPIAGALVRIGARAAITDRDGKVRFSGLDPALHRVFVEAQGKYAGSMITGDLTVDLRNDDEEPVEFSIVATRGGHVNASVRLLSRRGTVGTASAELSDAGGVSGMIVQLIGARDTVYQMSDAAGRADFGNVAPGTYTIAVRAADAPDQTKFEHERIEIIVAAGTETTTEIRIVPRERVIRMIDAGSVKAGTR